MFFQQRLAANATLSYFFGCAGHAKGIAVDVGYSDSSFFTRLFRRKVGMTPAQYRQRFGRLARQIAAGGR